MAFLYPTFLFALSSLLVPVIIHLLHLRKSKKIYFTNVAFLKTIEVQSYKKRKIRNLLVLLARILFLFFLVSAFAQPYIPSATSFSSDAPSVVMYIDNSYSMQAERGGESALTRAIQQANEVVDIYPSTTSFQLITNDASIIKKDKKEIKDALAQISFSNHIKTLSDLKLKLKLMKDENKSLLDFYLFSDFQKNAGQASAVFFDTLTNYFFIPIITENTANSYIDSIWLAKPIMTAGTKNTLYISIANGGKEEMKNVRVKISLNNEQVAILSVNLSARAKEIIKSDIYIKNEKNNNGFIELDHDVLTFDNRFYFSFPAFDPVRILDIVEKTNTPTNYLHTVFSNDTFFVYQSTAVSQLTYTDISKYDLVILNELKNIPIGLQNALQSFLTKKKSLLIVPADYTLNLSSYQSIFIPWNIQLKIIMSTVSIPLNSPDMNHPFFENIFQEKHQVDMPMEKIQLSWSGWGDVILNSKNQIPYFTSFSKANSHIFLFASSLQDSSSHMGRHALFVPMMYTVAFMSNGSIHPFYYLFGNPNAILSFQTSTKNEIYKVRKEKMELIPDQRIVDGNAQLYLSEMEEAGYYEIYAADQLSRQIAFNYSALESNLVYYDEKELTRQIANNRHAKIITTSSSNDFHHQLVKRYHGVSLWKYCIILALIFLLLEIIFIHFQHLILKLKK